MTTSRSQIPVANLKQRIAALEQRNAESTASVQRATSPTPSITSTTSHSGSSNGALRDRIARFEKKGGVPVPRGRFGLGAPPSLGGPRRQGELYGNRIPIPPRTASGGTLPPSRPVSVTTSYDQRRSFSASSLITDFDDDHLDYSPMSSPTFTLPPDSPESLTSVPNTPDASPSIDFSNFKQPIARGTSFAQALGVARKAETEKEELQNSTTLVSILPSLPESDGRMETPIETSPIIVISSEDVSPVLMPETPIAISTSVLPTLPRDGSPPKQVLPNKELSHKHPETVTSNGTSTITTTAHNPLVTKEVTRVGTPPLVIRKRTPADLSTSSVVDKASKDPDPIAVSIGSQVLVSLPNPQAANLHCVSADNNRKEIVQSLPTSQPQLVEVDTPVPSVNFDSKFSTTELVPTLSFPRPDIVILNEQSGENVGEPHGDSFISPNAGVQSRKVGLTLDSDNLSLTDGSLVSPPPQSAHAPHRATTAPPGALDSFSTALAAKAITSPDSFLSPPGTGLHFGSPSSGGSSISSLGSRPMSMIETSPKFVTQLLRMTPATSRGVPMFLPPSHTHPRKSDFVYFPPTPEDEDTDFGSSQKPSHPNRLRSGSDPEDIRNMPSKQTFSAVVHRKVRETPAPTNVPDTKQRALPQTPQAQRANRATILETPLSPGHGELAALLHEAVLLEDTLNKGELPGENPLFEEEIRQKEKRAKEEAAVVATQAQAKAKTKAEDEQRSRLALAATRAQPKRDEATAGRLKHTFLVPLTKARSQHRKEVYTAKAETFFSNSEVSSPALPIQPKSTGLPGQSTANSFALMSATLPKMPASRPTVESASTSNSTAQLPTKSLKSPRFSSLRKFGSVSRATDGPSTRTNHSTSSEVSSEEGSPAIAHPNKSLEFAMTDTTSEFGGTGSTLSFPLVSPKKTSKTLMRATSFAEKLWSRTRTRSGGSTLSSTSEVNDRLVEESSVKTPALRVPTIGPPPSLDLPAIPRPLAPPQSQEEKDEPGEITSLRRSTSSKRSAMYFSPGPDLTVVPQIPPIVPGSGETTSQIPSTSLLPNSNETARPYSANSISSFGSLPSPLFGQELVDAFPSVPATTPATAINHRFPHREMNLATPTTASFDTALLSSAIHLASAHKLATPKANFKPLPSERVAPLSSTSGDIVR